LNTENSTKIGSPREKECFSSLNCPVILPGGAALSIPRKIKIIIGSIQAKTRYVRLEVFMAALMILFKNNCVIIGTTHK
jgi:hypothetical protein